MSIGDIMTTAMNSPDCSILTGMVMGSLFIVKWLFMLGIFIIIFKAIDRLAVEPFLEWIKKKIYKRKK